MKTTLLCINCGADITDCPERWCPTCNHDIGFPHIRETSKPEELEALEKRYQQALEDAKLRGCQSALENFAETTKATCAVINVEIDDLHTFMTRDNALYSTYALQVSGQTRKAAQSDNDRHRRAVDDLLFGVYGDKIRYAALSLDGSGVKSYGRYAMKLREIAIEKRAVLLEKNSYHFAKEHSLKPGDAIPSGCRAIWPERHKLAVAKLAGEISVTTSANDHQKILVFSEGNYNTDRFIEVHIYGPFDNKAVASVKGKSLTAKDAKFALLEAVKDYLSAAGKTWVEE